MQFSSAMNEALKAAMSRQSKELEVRVRRDMTARSAAVILRRIPPAVLEEAECACAVCELWSHSSKRDDARPAARLLGGHLPSTSLLSLTLARLSNANSSHVFTPTDEHRRSTGQGQLPLPAPGLCPALQCVRLQCTLGAAFPSFHKFLRHLLPTCCTNSRLMFPPSQPPPVSPPPGAFLDPLVSLADEVDNIVRARCSADVLTTCSPCCVSVVLSTFCQRTPLTPAPAFSSSHAVTSRRSWSSHLL